MKQKENFNIIMSFLMKTFTYWDTLKYENKNNDHSILVESKMYCIKVNWFDSKSGGFIWSSKGSTDKLLLEVGEKGEKIFKTSKKRLRRISIW